jgi:ribulose 1,5-bisphosphate carboxylase large subunit-like protein
MPAYYQHNRRALRAAAGTGGHNPSGAMIRAVFELEPAGRAGTLALRASDGIAPVDGMTHGRVISERGGRAVLEFPRANWGASVPLLVSALVAGEGMEMQAFTRCRLVDLRLPEGFLPGPRYGAALVARHRRAVAIGVIVKPALGLSPAGVSEVARAAIAGGATLIKDDEILGDPTWCPLEERVQAVAEALQPGVVYCANVTGPSATLLTRARRAVELGATGVMINAFAQGLDSVLTLRQADLGVPIFAHRAGSGP